MKCSEMIGGDSFNRLVDFFSGNGSSSDSEPGGHWLPGVQRDGVLGDLVKRANHYAVTVSDVSKSLQFYKDVLGLQQTKRPNFDRYGAWLTAGNLEVHLIKGTPVVPSGDHLVVGHLSLEVDPAKIMEVPKRLRAAGVPFSQNQSVPTGDELTVVTQFFLRDPDGYYVEICNCDILTKFVLGQSVQLQYNETNVDVGMQEMLRLHKVADRACQMYVKRVNEKPEDLILPRAAQAKKPDPVLLKNMMRRSGIWSDLMQGETEEKISRALVEANNNAPLATRIIRARKIEGGKIFIPPAILTAEGELYQPEAVKQRAAVLDEAKAEEILLATDPRTLFKRLFEKADKDGSRSICPVEAVSAFKKLCPGTSTADIKDMFKTFDVDGSGELEFAEFDTMCRKLMSSQSEKKWRAIFGLMDDDGNEKLSVAEVNHKLHKLGMPLSDAETEELFLEFDTDGSGYIEEQEFVNLMCSDSALVTKASAIKPED